jgi:hypothetical protein
LFAARDCHNIDPRGDVTPKAMRPRRANASHALPKEK